MRAKSNIIKDESKYQMSTNHAHTLQDFHDFETDILEKFNHLIKIENFSKKL